ncbi:tetratricopeptide repeat protein [Candidatus Dependentiae bacterium]|nr:tetratricopeptide repeat protein [Candidatus Dependentiae bacterium]
MKKISNTYKLLLFLILVFLFFELSSINSFSADTGIVIRTKQSFLSLIHKKYKQKKYDEIIEIMNEYKNEYFSGSEQEYRILFESYLNTFKYQELIDEYNSMSEVFSKNKEFDGLLQEAKAGLKQQTYLAQVEKIKNIFYKAESFYSGGNLEEAEKLYRHSLEVLPSANIYEIGRSRERLKQIESDILKRKINLLKEEADNSTDNEKLGNILQIYYKEYRLRYKNINSTETKYFFDKLIEYLKNINIDELNKNYDLYQKYLTGEEQIGIKIIVAERFLAKGKTNDSGKYIEDLKKQMKPNDKKLNQLISKHNSSLIWKTIKIIFSSLIIIITLLLIIFRKKTVYYILLLKMKYFESSEDTDNLIKIYRSISNYKKNDNIIGKLLRLSLNKKTSEHEIISIYEKLNDLNELNIEQIIQILKILIKNNKVSESKELVKFAKKNYQNENNLFDILTCEFEIFTILNDSEHKIKILEELLKIKFESDYVKQAILIYCSKKEFKNAYKFLRIWLKHQPNMIKKIIEFVEKILEKYDNNVKLFDFLGILYRKIGETDKAIDIYEKLLEKHKSKLPVYSVLFDLYQKKNDMEKSIIAGEEVVKMRIDNFEDKIVLSQLYYKTGKIENAVELLAELILHDANNLRVNNLLTNIANYYSSHDMIEKSIKIFELLISNTNIEITPARIELGKLYIKINQPDNAISSLQKIQTGEKGNIYISQLLMAQALTMKTDYQLAIEILNKIDENDISINSETKKFVCYSKAYCYEILKEYELAKKYYQIVILQDISYKDANIRYTDLLNNNI